MSVAYARLCEFVDRKMRMSHIYQPVMLQVLLSHGGRASIRRIAQAFLGHDESQLDYYEQIVKNMPGRVLATHRVVERDGDTYALGPELAGVSEEERVDLIRRCEEAVERFKQKRGSAIWQHRRPGLGMIPGRVRYDTLKRAGFRCELCGVSADERALDVDHIVPRKHGGTDDPENLQALCWQCNANKGAGDDADFRGIRETYATRQEGCPFCDPPRRPAIAENPLAILIEDGFPVTDGHLLAIPRRHVADYFDLRQSERNAVQRLLDHGRGRLLSRHPGIAGFNVGINAGAVAGQTIFHCHVHLIPRRAGDVDNPRGGVRGVVPGKQDYASDPLARE
jgi:diadenosine tetraphosphate (Ap4A) HIT family hydrolase/5-methylcytosine-specific restriction endonuclease McrA